MLPVSSALPVISRRRVLLGTAALAVLGAAASACGSPLPPPEVDELVAQLGRARSDSQLAADAADAAPELRRVLTVVAAERDAHAQALSEEIARIIGPAAAETSTSAPSSTTAEPVRPPDLAEVIGALRRSADSAAHLATQVSGYRAGLLGSIAAACTALVAVPLEAPERAS